jgi:phage host-nuclease inhibitor protein Gam
MNVLDLVKTAEEMQPAADLLPPECEGYADEQDPEVRGAWSITSPGSADWALLRLAECEAEVAEIERQGEAAKARIDARVAALRAKAGRGIAYFTFKLTEYAAAHRSEIVRGKRKSRDYVHGRIAFRNGGGRLVVTDEKALKAWVEAQPVELGLGRVEVKPDKKAIDEWYAAREAEVAAALERGEVVAPVQPPPGMEWEPARENVTVTANAPETALSKE